MMPISKKSFSQDEHGKRLCSLFALLVLSVSFLLVASCAGVNAAPVKSVVADTPAGPLLGALEDDVIVYRGIPYALPPLGAWIFAVCCSLGELWANIAKLALFAVF